MNYRNPNVFNTPTFKALIALREISQRNRNIISDKEKIYMQQILLLTKFSGLTHNKSKVLLNVSPRNRSDFIIRACTKFYNP